MQVIFLVPLRYPTEKAYGTNISYTAEAFSKKNHEVTIIAPGKNSLDQRGNEVIGVENVLTKISQSFSNSKFSPISRVGFYLANISFSLTANKITRKYPNDTLFITRSPITAFFTRVSQNQRIILEVHHIPSEIELVLLKLDPRKPKLYVTNNDFKKQLINLGVKNEIFIVPNAAPDSFFELGRKNRKLIRPLTIGFAGKSTSSGNDNDLDIALRLLRRFPSVAKDFHFNFVGCEKSFVERVTNMFSDGLIPEGSISVMEHLSNDELLQAISKFDLAIIPYPDNEYYERSFPIKIVEMMAAGIPMLSSQTKAHIRILGDSYKLFFEAGSEESLKKLLDLVVADEQLISTERQKFAGLSKEFTYSRKVDLIENIRSA